MPSQGSTPKVSVVMSTFNGSRFVLQQLDSLLHQSRIPNEIVVADDQSVDDTAAICRRYAEHHKKETQWKLVVNTQNKGYARSFIDAAKMCDGDVIFFCDQDDVWDPKKIERMLAVFEFYPDALAAHCYARSIDAESNVVRTAYDRYASPRNNVEYSKDSLLELLKYRRSPGLCLAFRKEVLPELEYLHVQYSVPHDLPIGFIAAVYDGYYSVNDVLVDHRITGTNASNPHKSIRSRILDRKYQIASTKNALKYFDIVLTEYADKLDSCDYVAAENGRNLLRRLSAVLEDGGASASSLFALMFAKCESVSVYQKGLILLCCLFG